MKKFLKFCSFIVGCISVLALIILPTCYKYLESTAQPWMLSEFNGKMVMSGEICTSFSFAAVALVFTMILSFAYFYID